METTKNLYFFFKFVFGIKIPKGTITVPGTSGSKL